MIQLISRGILLNAQPKKGFNGPPAYIIADKCKAFPIGIWVGLLTISTTEEESRIVSIALKQWSIEWESYKLEGLKNNEDPDQLEAEYGFQDLFNKLLNEHHND